MNNKKRKIIRKAISLYLSLVLTFNPIWAKLAFAQEVIEEEPVLETQEESTITTGDADSTSDTDTIANVEVSLVDGEVTTPEEDCADPEVNSDCEETIITDENLTVVENSAEADSTTGDNEILNPETDAAIDTGDADFSQGTIDNINNINVTLFTDSEDSDDEESEGEPEIGLTESAEILDADITPTPEIQIENLNVACADNDGSTSSLTGDNLIIGADDAEIMTGDAQAVFDLANLINVNVVSSQFDIDLTEVDLTKDVNLNEIWEGLGETSGSDGFGSDVFIISNENLAQVDNDVDVLAKSGGNETSFNEGKAAIDTGDSLALANVINLININILGTKFYLGVININGDYDGDVIVPRPEKFLCLIEESLLKQSTQESGEEIDFQNTNVAFLNNNIKTSADSGSNLEAENGVNQIVTSGSEAYSNSFSLVNTNIRFNNWFFLLVNMLGTHSGNVLGWGDPTSENEGQSEASVTYQTGDNPETLVNEELLSDIPNQDPLTSKFINKNNVVINNDINVSAITGENTALYNMGGAQINTGYARALANLFNLANLNIIGSSWFMGIVNVMGNWTGNLVFAYPDVAVNVSSNTEITPGSSFEYRLRYENKGYDTAEGVELHFELPDGVSYLADSQGAILNGNILTWGIGNLAQGAGGEIVISVLLSPDFTPEEDKLSFWDKLIPVVHAEDEKTQIVGSAQIATSDPESDTENNSATVATIVDLSKPDFSDNSEENNDTRLPVLEVFATNNVNDFVYAGDTVTFQVEIKNTGAVASYETTLYQGLYNGVPGDFGFVKFYLGTIEPGKGGTLGFGVKLANSGILKEGNYHTETYAVGRSPNKTLATSNRSRTDFSMKYHLVSYSMDVAAQKEEDVLAYTTENECPTSEKDPKVLEYLLMMIVSGMYLSKVAKGKLQEETDSTR